MPTTEDNQEASDAPAQRHRSLQAEEARYTLVLHSSRKKLGLTINEYCVADTIHKLSGQRSAVPGWFYGSKENLAKGLGLSRQSIYNIVKKLKDKQLIEVQPQTGYLHTTDLWYDTVEVVRNTYFGKE